MKEDLVSKDVAHKDNKKKRMRGKRKKKPWPSDLGIEGMVARGLEPLVFLCLCLVCQRMPYHPSSFSLL